MGPQWDIEGHEIRKPIRHRLLDRAAIDRIEAAEKALDRGELDAAGINLGFVPVEQRLNAAWVIAERKYITRGGHAIR